MRMPIIAGNWKMHTTPAEARKLVSDMLPTLDKVEGVDKLLCPPFVSLFLLRELLKDTSIRLGAQNMYFEVMGAYTGEISPLMLVDLCHFVILGHSERRWHFGENDKLINNKIKSALSHKLIPILCVGERLEERESGKAQEVISNQLYVGLSDVATSSEIVIAYEPVWAIGTGKAATSKQAADTIKFIRDTLASIWDGRRAQEIRILYGGSVTGENIAELMSQPEIDGALVGGASLRPEEFVSIVSQAAKTKGKPII
ncbi:MAG: triose-phosphate isomerase [Chloroflexota bacterium]|nr:triose-phosphate isomerase [Chloroflexota bacterium]